MGQTDQCHLLMPSSASWFRGHIRDVRFVPSTKAGRVAATSAESYYASRTNVHTLGTHFNQS